MMNNSRMIIESSNDEASTNVLPFAKPLLGDVFFHTSIFTLKN